MSILRRGPGTHREHGTHRMHGTRRVGDGPMTHRREDSLVGGRVHRRTATAAAMLATSQSVVRARRLEEGMPLRCDQPAGLSCKSEAHAARFAFVLTVSKA